MYKIIILLLIVIFYNGCGAKPTYTNKKMFAQEDFYILAALESDRAGHFSSASLLYKKLYNKTDRKEYLYSYLKDDLILKRYKDVITKVDKLLDGSYNDAQLIRFRVIALMGDNQLKLAKKQALKLVSLSNKVENYLLVADVYRKEKKFNTAVRYLESAYIKNYNEKLLDEISIILYVDLGKKKEAIAQLETHSMTYGCSKLICNRLLSFYADLNDSSGLLSTYMRLYNLNKNPEIAKKIVYLYEYKREYLKLMNFLERTGCDDDKLLSIYKYSKSYKKAYKLAYKLYKETNNIDYLINGNMIEYSIANKKEKKKLEKKIVANLKKVVELTNDSSYLNYLGYMLIDNSIDIHSGIKYIKRALKDKPNSIYYLDSLAWGYYRLGNCKKAYHIMNRVFKLNKHKHIAKEILQHQSLIKKCYKKRYRRKR